MKIFILSLIAVIAFAKEPMPPKIYKNVGLCPGECCAYKDWKVYRDTKIYKSIGSKKVVGTAKKGTEVEGLTGEVWSKPFKYKNKAGSTVYILTSIGEGIFDVWDDGLIRRSDGDEFDNAVYGKVPRDTWWMQIKLPNGVIGWSKEDGNFDEGGGCH